MKLKEEYCWAIKETAGRSCSGRSGSIVLEFVFLLTSLLTTYILGHEVTPIRTAKDLPEWVSSSKRLSTASFHIIPVPRRLTQRPEDDDRARWTVNTIRNLLANECRCLSAARHPLAHTSTYSLDQSVQTHDGNLTKRRDACPPPPCLQKVISTCDATANETCSWYSVVKLQADRPLNIRHTLIVRCN